MYFINCGESNDSSTFFSPPFWALLLSSAPEELICACMRVCGSGGGCSCVWISNGEMEKKEPHASVRACTFPHAPQPEVDYHGVNCN